MAIALTVAKGGVSRSGNQYNVTFNLTFSNAPSGYPTGGDVTDFTKATDPNFQSYRIPFGPPKSIDLTNTNPGGFDTEAVIGTTNATCKLKMFTAGSGSAAPVEHTNGVYEAAILADTNCQITVTW